MCWQGYRNSSGIELQPLLQPPVQPQPRVYRNGEGQVGHRHGVVNMMSIHSNPGYLDKLLMLESINVGLAVFQGHWLSVESSLGSKVSYFLKKRCKK